MGVSPVDGQCGKFKAEVAFACISAIIWMASAVLNILIIRREGRQEDSDVRDHYQKREKRQNSVEV